MDDQELFKVFRSHVTDAAGVDHTFYFRFYKGCDCKVPAEYRGIERKVNINALKLIIERITTYEDDHEVIDSIKQDFGYISARSGEMSYCYRQLKGCKTLEEMNDVIEELRTEFYHCMEKDAYRELKKQLGIRPEIMPPSKLKRKTHPEPLEHIHLPRLKKR